jgi:hypothetical protein
MIQFNVDPYDMLMQLNARAGATDNYIKELQLSQLQLSKMLEQQTQLIKQLQQNEQVLSEAIGHLLLKQPK